MVTLSYTVHDILITWRYEN